MRAVQNDGAHAHQYVVLDVDPVPAWRGPGGAQFGLDLLEHPELLEQPYNAALSAAEWWHRHGCNELADTGDMAAVTRKVNGGLTGLDDRLKLYAGAMTYIGSA